MFFTKPIILAIDAPVYQRIESIYKIN
jgi:hypothetical protein